VHGHVSVEKDISEKHHATLEERLAIIEQQLGECSENNSQAMAKLECHHKEFSCSLSQLHGHVSREKESREGHHATVNERLEHLEKYVGESADKHGKHIEAVNAKFNLFSGNLTAEKGAREKQHLTIEERLALIDRQIKECSESQAEAVGTQKNAHKELCATIDRLHSHVRVEKDTRESHCAT